MGEKKEACKSHGTGERFKSSSCFNIVSTYIVVMTLIYRKIMVFNAVIKVCLLFTFNIPCLMVNNMNNSSKNKP